MSPPERAARVIRIERPEPERAAPETRSTKIPAGYRVLQLAFIIIPIVVGIDKFFHRIVNWDMYLSPVALRVLGSHAHLVMKLSGVGEICIGIGMIFRPRLFAYIVTAWLFAIVVNLILTGAYLDIALRDFVLALCSLALCSLALGQFSDSFRDHAKR